MTEDLAAALAASLRRHASLRQYAPSVVATCAECDGDLQHEGGDQYWCPNCHVSFHFTQVQLQPETDYDRD